MTGATRGAAQKDLWPFYFCAFNCPVLSPKRLEEMAQLPGRELVLMKR